MARNDSLNLADGSAKVPNSKDAPGWLCRTPVLAAIIFAAIVFNDAQVIFHSYQYEINDVASNSLQVVDAKRFHNVLGNYSRFGFYHPGPAFFYVYALGEALFYDATHLVPTPFNAQFIALDALSAFFFGATLALVARHLGGAQSRWFLGLALLLAAWHFGAVGRFFEFIPGGLFCIWPPCVLVMPFLCFLVASASVASGAGRDLPLMTLAGCFLVHGHVGQPLFVIPIALLAYGGLVHHARRAASQPQFRPWQVFRRQHWLSGALIVAFLIPIAVDIITTHPNNIHLILDHIRANQGERKEFLRSLLYFLHFGAYTAYPSSVHFDDHTAYPNVPYILAFDAFDASGTVLFFRTHWRAYGLWLMAVLLPLAMLLKRAKHPSDRSAPITTAAPRPAKIDITRFLWWMYVVLSAAIFLTIVWGCLQDGPMFYFNALFNFAIYFGFLLIFAIAVVLWIEDRLSTDQLASSPSRPATWRNRMRTYGPAVIALIAVAVLAQESRRFRSAPTDQNQQRMFGTSLEKALKSDPTQSKVLIFEAPAWAEALGVALYLHRSRYTWTVVSYSSLIPVLFGRSRVITDVQTEAPKNSSIWRVLPRKDAVPLEADSRWKVFHLTKKAILVIPSNSGNETPVEK
jgi:hypothetical protein